RSQTDCQMKTMPVAGSRLRGEADVIEPINVSASSRRRLRIMKRVLFMCALISSAIVPALAGEGSLGLFEDHGDIGSPKLAGSATYDAATQEYTMTGAGTNMWFGRDQFHFLWKRMKGDFILRARLEFIGKGAVQHRKAGWMVRPSLEPDAPYAD